MRSMERVPQRSEGRERPAVLHSTTFKKCTRAGRVHFFLITLLITNNLTTFCTGTVVPVFF